MPPFVQCPNEAPHSAHHWNRYKEVRKVQWVDYGSWCPGLKPNEGE